MATEVRAFTESELNRLGEESTLSKVLYVIRRWPLIPLFILFVLAMCAFFAPLIAPHDPIEDQLRAVIASPAWYPPCEDGQISNKIQSCNTNGIPLGRDEKVYNFLLGADQLGRDIVSRIVYGARISLTFASIAIACGTIVGTSFGLIAGYYGGLIDEIVMRITDVFTALPYLIIAISIVIVMGQSFWVIVPCTCACQLARHTASGARSDAPDKELRLYSSGARCRRVHSAHYVQTPAARRREYGRGRHDSPGWQYHPVREHTVVSGRGSTASHAILGCGHFQWQRVSRFRVVDCFLPGNGYIPDGAVIQFHW